jgi:putative spermidine/putrescine transport system permease protein
MHLSPAARLALRIVTAIGLAFVYVPILVVVISSFNRARIFTWPPDGYTLDWWARTWDNPGARAALGVSLRAALGATAVAHAASTSAGAATTSRVECRMVRLLAGASVSRASRAGG